MKLTDKKVYITSFGTDRNIILSHMSDYNVDMREILDSALCLNMAANPK